MNATVSLFLVIAAATAGVTGVAALWVRGRRKTPEQREQQRRIRLSEMGRITDGTVMDVGQMTLNSSKEIQLLMYRYVVAGVSYEASQDVTHLRHKVDLHSCRLGVPASIKYDPANPGNSIVVAESWSGLRQ